MVEKLSARHIFTAFTFLLIA